MASGAYREHDRKAPRPSNCPDCTQSRLDVFTNIKRQGVFPFSHSLARSRFTLKNRSSRCKPEGCLRSIMTFLMMSKPSATAYSSLPSRGLSEEWKAACTVTACFLAQRFRVSAGLDCDSFVCMSLCGKSHASLADGQFPNHGQTESNPPGRNTPDAP